MSARRAIYWSIFWVLLSLLINLGVYFAYGQQKAMEFLTGYIIEKSLSVDNLFVFPLIFNFFETTPKQQRRVLNYGIIGVVILKYSPVTASLIWNLSRGGTWLLPLVLVAALLDSVHPCSFSILLITIAFLFGMQMTRKKILQIGGTYIAGIFAAYLFRH